MSNKKNCPTCNGQGYHEVLVSQHDTEKETVKCINCNGSGVIHTMTDEEERDYHEDYW